MIGGVLQLEGQGASSFSTRGRGFNGQWYLRLLDEKLELFMGFHNSTHFLQNGAPCPKAKIVMAWFNARPNITLIKWLGNSPDLNPIENAWNWMKNLWKSTSCKNMEEWKADFRRLWTLRMVDSNYLKALVESIPRRLAEVIE
jgi:hypothetical protein